MAALKAKTFTDQEAQFVVEVFKHIEGGMPKVDWEAVAKASGLKNGNTANTKFYKIKKKMGLISEGAQASTHKMTPNKVTKKTSKPMGTITKPGIKRKVKEAFAFTAINEDDIEEDEGKNDEASGSEPVFKLDDENFPLVKEEAFTELEA